jgi:hypothetical protein
MACLHPLNCVLALSNDLVGGSTYYMYTDPSVRLRNTAKLARVQEFDRFLLSNVAAEVFGTQPVAALDARS